MTLHLRCLTERFSHLAWGGAFGDGGLHRSYDGPSDGTVAHYLGMPEAKVTAVLQSALPTLGLDEAQFNSETKHSGDDKQAAKVEAIEAEDTCSAAPEVSARRAPSLRASIVSHACALLLSLAVDTVSQCCCSQARELGCTRHLIRTPVSAIVQAAAPVVLPCLRLVSGEVGRR